MKHRKSISRARRDRRRWTRDRDGHSDLAQRIRRRRPHPGSHLGNGRQCESGRRWLARAVDLLTRRARRPSRGSAHGRQRRRLEHDDRRRMGRRLGPQRDGHAGVRDRHRGGGCHVCHRRCADELHPAKTAAIGISGTIFGAPGDRGLRELEPRCRSDGARAGLGRATSRRTPTSIPGSEGRSRATSCGSISPAATRWPTCTSPASTTRTQTTPPSGPSRKTRAGGSSRRGDSRSTWALHLAGKPEEQNRVHLRAGEPLFLSG